LKTNVEGPALFIENTGAPAGLAGALLFFKKTNAKLRSLKTGRVARREVM